MAAVGGRDKKSERLDLRMTPEAKALIERGAAISGIPVTAFIISIATRQAKRLVRESESIELSNRDRDRLLDALDDTDAKPNAALRRAARRYKKDVG